MANKNASNSRKSASLKNFTGTVKVNPNGSVTISGKGKAAAKRATRRNYSTSGSRGRGPVTDNYTKLGYRTKAEAEVFARRIRERRSGLVAGSVKLKKTAADGLWRVSWKTIDT